MSARDPEKKSNSEVSTVAHKRNWVAMPEIDAIVNHPVYLREMACLKKDEAKRKFCRHGSDHLLDVARIAYIAVLERGLSLRKEVVYAAALLHDVGKARQYEDKEPHEVAGARLTEEILRDNTGFTPDEKTVIATAVGEHRRFSPDASTLGQLLYEADKSSRACWDCDQREACKWPQEKMNLEVRI